MHLLLFLPSFSSMLVLKGYEEEYEFKKGHRLLYGHFRMIYWVAPSLEKGRGRAERLRVLISTVLFYTVVRSDWITSCSAAK